MGLFNFSRLGTLFGAPVAAMSSFPAVELGTGSAVVAQGTNTTLDAAIVPEDNVIYPGFPTQRDELSLAMYSENTNAGPLGGSAHFMVQKDPVTLDQFNYQMRTFSTAGSRTFDWSWYSVAT